MGGGGGGHTQKNDCYHMKIDNDDKNSSAISNLFLLCFFPLRLPGGFVQRIPNSRCVGAGLLSPPLGGRGFESVCGFCLKGFLGVRSEETN